MKRETVRTGAMVVLWEDDPVRRPLLAAILDGAGLAVTSPTNAAAVLDRIVAEPRAVLVIDANTSHPSGAEFLRELQHRFAGRVPPTLALLQPGQACLRAAVRELGVQRVLNEPFSPGELVSAVRGLGRGQKAAA